ncbi:MAG: DUF2721 domain-containing protein [Burkholderiales bacterium]
MAVETQIYDITHVIQLAVAPVFMLTAVGTIISALNIRLGRAVDRRRVLEPLRTGLAGEQAKAVGEELAQVARRIHSIYLAILFAVLSALFVCLLIATAFLGAFVALNLSSTIGALFVLAVLALIVCLLFFLREIFLAVIAPRRAAH